MAYPLQLAAPMRCVCAAVLLVSILQIEQAGACPDWVTDASTDETPATSSPCLSTVDFTAIGSSLDLRYAAGAKSAAQTDIGATATAFAALEVAYAMQFGSEPEHPSYEIEVSGGVAAQRVAGNVSATGLVTRAHGRIGPARLRPAVIDEGRGNLAWFPLTMELAHVGELAARPRISSRPEVARGLYDRERVALATRLLRVEGAGDKASRVQSDPSAPAITYGLDVIPLHAEVDVAKQGSTRLETAVGGALLGARKDDMTLELLGLEHRRFDLTMTEPFDLDTIWVLRVDGINPDTGTRYYAGWGEVVVMPDGDELGRRLDPENEMISIGGIGGFYTFGWGGLGAQYKREPYVAMTGAAGLEDRVSAEVSLPRALGLVLRGFAARTTRLVDGELQHDRTAGVEIDASYSQSGLTYMLGLEAGRTFYDALDGAAPQTTGFSAGAGLTIQYSASRTWQR